MFMWHTVRTNQSLNHSYGPSLIKEGRSSQLVFDFVVFVNVLP